MPGQLWQQCVKRGCSTEPVCVDCEYCARHCRCGKPAQPAIDNTCPEPYRRGIGQGFGPTEDGEVD